jgi:hypothetical protein
VTLTKLGDFLQSRRKLFQLAGATEGCDSSQLFVRGLACAHEIGMVRVGQSIGARASSGHHRALFEHEHGLTGTCKGEHVRDRFHSLRVSDGVSLAVEHPELPSFLRGNASQERRPVARGGANLEVRRTWPAQRSATEHRASEVCSPTARPPDNAPWRVFERAEPRAEHAGLMQHLKRTLFAVDVQLVARRAVEGAPPVRPDLGGDAESPQQAERTPSHGGVRKVEVNGHLATSPQVDAAGRVEEAGELRQPVAIATGRYAGELVT